MQFGITEIIISNSQKQFVPISVKDQGRRGTDPDLLSIYGSKGEVYSLEVTLGSTAQG